jgi:hypothetical protein
MSKFAKRFQKLHNREERIQEIKRDRHSQKELIKQARNDKMFARELVFNQNKLDEVPLAGE